jgi:hypothetical protein
MKKKEFKNHLIRRINKNKNKIKSMKKERAIKIKVKTIKFKEN